MNHSCLKYLDGSPPVHVCKSHIPCFSVCIATICFSFCFLLHLKLKSLRLAFHLCIVVTQSICTVVSCSAIHFEWHLNEPCQRISRLMLFSAQIAQLGTICSCLILHALWFAGSALKKNGLP